MQAHTLKRLMVEKCVCWRVGPSAEMIRLKVRIPADAASIVARAERGDLIGPWPDKRSIKRATTCPPRRRPGICSKRRRSMSFQWHLHVECPSPLQIKVVQSRWTIHIRSAALQNEGTPNTDRHSL
jgi:hypothetical protein